MECHSALKINELQSHGETQKTLKCILLSELRQPEKTLHCVTLTLWHSGKYKTLEDNKKNSGCRRWEVGLGGEQRTQGISRAVKIHYRVSQWQIHVIIHWPKPTECATPRMNPTVTTDCGWLWHVSVGSPLVTNVPFWRGMLTREKLCYAWVSVGAEWMGTSLYFQCFCKPKTALKKFNL